MTNDAKNVIFTTEENPDFSQGIPTACSQTEPEELAVNGIHLHYEQSELIELILSIASGKTDRQGLLQWIFEHQ